MKAASSQTTLRRSFLCVILTLAVLPVTARAPWYIYATSPNGNLSRIDTMTGVGTLVGPLPSAVTELEVDFLTGTAYAQWSDGSFKLQQIDLATGASAGPPLPTTAAYNGLEFVSGVLYATGIPGPFNPSTLYTVDPATGTGTAVGLTGFGPIGGLAHDGSTLFGITSGGVSSVLVTVNTSTGVATPVGDTGVILGSLEFGLDGTLYAGGGQTHAGQLFTIDKTTGAPTHVGSTGLGETISGLSMAPWHFHATTPGGTLFLVDPATGAGSPVGPLPSGMTELEVHPATGAAYAQWSNGSFIIQQINLSTGGPAGPQVATGVAYNGLEFVPGGLLGSGVTEPGGGSLLYAVNPITGAGTPIGLTGFGPIGGLAYDGSTLYGITSGGMSSNLVTIDTSTGAATPVDDTGLILGSLETGPDGLLYAGGGQTNAGELYTIDKLTGTPTLVGSTGLGETISGLSGAVPAARILAGHDSAECGQQIVVPITVEDTRRLQAFGFRLNFNPGCISYVGAGPGADTADWLAVEGNEFVSGVVIVGGLYGDGTSVPPGAEREIALVTFECSSSPCGCASDILITHLVDDLTGYLPLHGQGVCLDPEVSVTVDLADVPDGTGSVDFGIVTQGDPAPAKHFLVSNTGTADLTTSPPSVPAGFSLTDGLEGTIPPGESDTFTVEMSTAAPGTPSGEISFANNDTDENPFNFAVSGTVNVPPAPEVSVSVDLADLPDGAGPIVFATVTQGDPAPAKTFTVSNTGNADLTTSPPEVPAGYSVTEGLDAIIAPAGSDTFTVELSSAAIGTFTGQISFTNNDSDENPFDFTVSGIVDPPPAPEVSVSVDLADVPDGTGSVDFGTAVEGDPAPQKIFTVSNTGTASLTTSPPSVPAGFSLVEELDGVIPPAGSDTFTVEMSTGTPGTPSGEISFANNDDDENPFNFAVNGVVDPAPEPEVVVSEDGADVPDGTGSISFGTVTQGAAAPVRIFTVENTGTAELTTLTLTAPGGFAIIEDLAGSIPIGGSDTFTVEMPTDTVGTPSGDITFDNNDSDENPFNFLISGEVAPPPTVFAGTGSAGCGEQFTIPIDVSGAAGVEAFGLNLAFDTLCVSFVSVQAGTDTSDWQTVDGSIGAAGTITLGGMRGAGTVVSGDAELALVTFECAGIPCSCESPLTLSDLTDGIAGADVLDGSGGCVEPEVVVTLGSTDIPDGTAVAIDFGGVVRGAESPAKTFRVHNDGLATLTTSGLSIPPGFTLVGSLDAMIPPAGVDSFTIEMNTDTVGTKSGEITFGNNDADEDPFNFPITGVVVEPSDLLVIH